MPVAVAEGWLLAYFSLIPNSPDQETNEAVTKIHANFHWHCQK
jgi:hypothetical protein